MSVLNRFSDIVSANLNAALDQAEDPRKMARLWTQQMQQTLEEVESSVVHYEKEIDAVKEQVASARRASVDWQAKTEYAVHKNRDDLARAALAEKTYQDELAETLTQDLHQLEISRQKLEQDTASLKLKIDQARDREKSLILRGQVAQSRIRVKQKIHQVNTDRVMSRFDAYERKLDDELLEGENIASIKLSNEIEQLQHVSHQGVIE